MWPSGKMFGDPAVDYSKLPSAYRCFNIEDTFLSSFQVEPANVGPCYLSPVNDLI